MINKIFKQVKYHYNDNLEIVYIPTRSLILQREPRVDETYEMRLSREHIRRRKPSGNPVWNKLRIAKAY